MYKRLKLTLLVLIISSPMQKLLSQESVNETITRKGQLSFGLNAVPVLSWFGNSFNGNMDNDYIGQQKFRNNNIPNFTIKYALDDALFARVTYGGNRFIMTTENRVNDDSKANSPFSEVSDFQTNINNSWAIGVGLEKRRTNGKIQGFYGLDVAYGRINNKSNFQYGNAFSELNQTPTSTNDFISKSSARTGSRLIENTVMNAHEIGLRTFLGVEYFFKSYISIGVEFGWTMAYQYSRDLTTKSESYSTGSKQSILTERVQGSQQAYTDLLDNQNGAVMLNFYF